MNIVAFWNISCKNPLKDDSLEDQVYLIAVLIFLVLDYFFACELNVFTEGISLQKYYIIISYNRSNPPPHD